VSKDGVDGSDLKNSKTGIKKMRGTELEVGFSCQIRRVCKKMD
jgi:hypothetical protein